MRALVLAIALFACGNTSPHVKVDHVVDAALSGIVKGTVAGEGGPLVGVVVSMTVNGVDFVELTDETGAFTIKQALPVGRYKIKLFYVGQTIEREIDVLADRATVLRVTNLRDSGGDL